MTGNPESGGPIGERIVIVLNEPKDIVNIAGTARAMMNMGLRRLRLVRPDVYDAHRISGIAHGSERILDRIEFFDTLTDATDDVSRTVGTTARRRTSTFVWHHLRDAAPELVEFARTNAAPVAIVFGREDRGLSNDELDLCDRLITVPTNPDHASLNLAQTVLLVAYELRLAAEAAGRLPRPKRKSEPATSRDLRSLFEDTRRALQTVEFFKSRNAPMVMRSLRAVIRRAEPTSREAGLLRAMVIEVRKYFERITGEGESEG